MSGILFKGLHTRVDEKKLFFLISNSNSAEKLPTSVNIMCVKSQLNKIISSVLHLSLKFRYFDKNTKILF